MRSKINVFLDFIGLGVLKLSVVSLVVGGVQFFAEIGLGLGVQGFLVTLGLLQGSEQALPDWLPRFTHSQVLLFLIFMAAVKGLAHWAQIYVAGISLLEFECLNRSRVLRWAFYNRNASSAEVSNLFNNRVNGASNFVASIQSSLVRCTVITLLLVSLFKLSWSISIIALFSLAMVLLPIRFLNSRIHKLSRDLSVRIENIVSHFLMSVKNLLLLHIYGTYRHEEGRTQEALLQYKAQYAKYYKTSGLKSILPSIFGIWVICLISWVATSFVKVEAGMLLTYFYLFMRFVQALSEVSNLSSYLVLTWPQMKDYFNWWSDEARLSVESFEQKASGDARFYSPIGWDFKDVSFCYARDTKFVLSGFNLTINPGEALVVTGPSGSGKSTLLSLFLGLHTQYSGSITLIHEDCSKFDLKRTILSNIKERVLSSIGYVGPENFIVSGTVFENVVYGLADKVTLDEVHEALKKAECQFVYQFPSALEHRLTEQGEGLSAGQKQRLALARALLRKPKALILDEATSNLDLETEEKLVKILKQLKGELTLIIVTHREALLTLADKKIVLCPN